MLKFLAHASPPFLVKIELSTLGRKLDGGPFVPFVPKPIPAENLLVGKPATARWIPGLLATDNADWPIFDTAAEALVWLVGKAAEDVAAARAALQTAETIHTELLKCYQAQQRETADSLSA